MSIEKPLASASETLPEHDSAQAEKVSWETYLKTHKEVVLSESDEAMTPELKQELMSRVGEAVFDGNELDYIDNEGSWARVSMDYGHIGEAKEEQMRDALETNGFKCSDTP